MQNQAFLIILTVLMNTASGAVAMSLFKPGSAGFIACALAGMVLSNTLAVFGKPLTKKAGDEEPKAILPGEVAK